MGLAALEPAALAKRYPGRRIAARDERTRPVAAWERERHERQAGVKWQFTTAHARVKLHRRYPPIQKWLPTSSADHRTPFERFRDLLGELV